MIEEIGGSLKNGFGFVLPIAPSLVENVEGQLLNGGFETVATNGSEIGTETNETVILVAGNVANL